MTREHLERRLDALLARLGLDELRVVEFLARRLLLGQAVYGRIALRRDARDFRTERLAEIGDLLVYTAFAELRRTLRRRRP